MVIEEVAVLIVLVGRHRRTAGAVVRRAVDDEFLGAVEEEAMATSRFCEPLGEIIFWLQPPTGRVLPRVILRANSIELAIKPRLFFR